MVIQLFDLDDLDRDLSVRRVQVSKPNCKEVVLYFTRSAKQLFTRTAAARSDPGHPHI